MGEITIQELPFAPAEMYRIKKTVGKYGYGVKQQLIKQLLNGYYLMESKRRGSLGYVSYHGKMNPERWYKEKSLLWLTDLLKKDKRERLTLNLSKVRQLHGKNLIKQLYKHKSAAAHSGTK